MCHSYRQSGVQHTEIPPQRVKSGSAENCPSQFQSARLVHQETNARRIGRAVPTTLESDAVEDAVRSAPFEQDVTVSLTAHPHQRGGPLLDISVLWKVGAT